MLDPDRLDLSELCMALEDNAPEHAWWLDPSSGELELCSELADSPEGESPQERGLVPVEPFDSSRGYSDMEDFARGVPDPRARELLLRAIAGRGAFRRFKDTLFEFEELRQAWFCFHDARMRRRAIWWLTDHSLIPEGAAEHALIAHPEPQLPASEGPTDAMTVAREVADELREIYGGRLKNVVLYGSWARGDAHPQSDIDLLIVLDEVPSRRAELERMNQVLWRHSLQSDTVVTELPISEAEYRESDEPILVRARAEGLVVA